MNFVKKEERYGIVAPSEKLAEELAERIELARTKDVWLGDLDLRGVLFDNVVFNNVSFAGADLSKTIFCGCKLCSDNLRGAKELVGARFCDCDMYGCGEVIEDFGRCTWEPYDKQLCNRWIWIEEKFVCETVIGPLEIDGEFFGYKYLYYGDVKLIAKLRIPADAERVCFQGEKCRASKVIVEEIRRLDNGEPCSIGVSPLANYPLVYMVGETVVADMFDNSYEECSHGIHFFLTEKEAIDYATR